MVDQVGLGIDVLQVSGHDRRAGLFRNLTSRQLCCGQRLFSGQHGRNHAGVNQVGVACRWGGGEHRDMPGWPPTIVSAKALQQFHVGMAEADEEEAMGHGLRVSSR